MSVLGKVVTAAVVVGLGAALGAWLEGNVAADHDRADNRGWTTAKAVRPASIAAAALVAVAVLGVDPAWLLAGLVAVVGLAVAIGAAPLVTNAAYGLWLGAIVPYDAGDVVGCGGEHGMVLRRGLFVTELAREDGSFVVVPNAVVGRAPIVNHTRSGRRRIELFVTVADLAARDELFARIGADPRVHAEPTVEVDGIEPDGQVRLAVRLWTSPADHAAVRAWLADAVATERARTENPAPSRSKRS